MAGGEGNRGLGYIYGGRVVSGFGIGAISAVAPAYVSECSPKQVRGRITGMFQIMVATGVMISYFVNCKYFFALFMLSDQSNLICVPQLGSVSTFTIVRRFGASPSGSNSCLQGSWHLAC